MKKALVTGSQGFVGRHMITRLRADDWRVTASDIKLGWGGDMLQMMRTERRYDLIVHAAARAPHRRAIDELHGAFPYNVMLDAALFEWAIRTGQPRIVYLSSSAVYPDEMQLEDSLYPLHILHEDYVIVDGPLIHQPHDDYGWTKILGERMAQRARQAGVNVTVVRPFSGYGQDQSADFPFGAFVERALRRENPFTVWGSASQVRDWIHIDDIIDAILVLVEADVTEPVNLCTGVGTTLGVLALMVCEAAGYEPMYDVDLDAPIGVFRRVGDPTRLRKHYTPRVTLEEGVARAFKE